jgi:hypothetical protein
VVPSPGSAVGKQTGTFNRTFLAIAGVAETTNITANNAIKILTIVLFFMNSLLLDD